MGLTSYAAGAVVLLAAIGTGACPAHAQVVVMEPVSGYYDWETKSSFTSVYQGGTAIDGGGSFDVLGFRARLGGGGPISQTVRLFMDVAYEHTAYDFGSASTAGCAIPAACFRGSPWQNVQTVDISPGASLVLNETLHIQAIVPIRWQAESGGERSGVTAGLIGMVRIRLSDSFTTGIGIGVQSELEQSTSVFPVVALDWRITQGIRLVTRGGPYQGADVALLMGPSKTIQFRLSTGYLRQRFRLTNGLPNPNGVGQYTAVPLLAGARLRLGQSAHLDVEAGVAVAGRLRIENAHGILLRAENFDTAALVRGRFRVDF